MPDAYDVHDAQFIQRFLAISGADALVVALPAVPAGKVWTFLSAFITTSVGEAQNFWFSIFSMASYFPVTRPLAFTTIPASYQYLPLVTEGMEIKLFPGEQLLAHRSAATAGSTISIYARVIETDLQYYVELDKAKVLRRRQAAMIESEPSSRGGMGSRGGGIRAPFGGRERPTRY